MLNQVLRKAVCAAFLALPLSISFASEVYKSAADVPVEVFLNVWITAALFFHLMERPSLQ